MVGPLVSCIMPTWNRRPFIRAAIDCFLAQTYEPRELIILDDGEDRVLDLVPKDERISYYDLSRRMTVGAKRNFLCQVAKGEIIVHWDTDDWSAPTRIADQVERLQRTGFPITGYGTMLFWDQTTGQAKRYRTSVRGYVCGTSLCYLKSHWRMKPFPNKNEAEDNAFVYSSLRQIAATDGSAQMVARIHDCHQTSSKKGIAEVVTKDLIHPAFWLNEQILTS